MTELQIKLRQPWAQGFIEAGAVATVRQLSDINGNRARPLWTREKPVDIAGEDGSSGEHSKFELPGGGYYEVEITRPRGGDISREFLIREGEVRIETITMEVSPHEYLSWQQYAGHVPADPFQRRRARFAGASLELHVAAPIPQVLATNLPASELAWDLVRDGKKGFAPWTVPGPLPSWPAPQWDDQFVTWFPPMPNLVQAGPLTEELRTKGLPPNWWFPRWLVFDNGSKIDLASVPWPWWGTTERNRDEEIRFVYDRLVPSSVDREAPGHLTISVQDRRWFGLLEFLASGRLSLTGEMSAEVLRKDDPREALYGKRKGPLAAVAGGIILVASAESSEKQEWDDWLENLSNWFPGIPDGPILLGYRRVQQAKDENDLRSAYFILREAIARGIPFFSACIRMLGLALAQISEEIPEAEKSRRNIAVVSTRVDPDQPFTVIRV